MTSAFRAVCAEPWAITPEWLHVIASLALRDREAPAVQAMGGDKPIVTPADRFAALFHIDAAVRPLDGQGSGRAIVADRVAVVPVLGPIFPRANMMTANSGATSLASFQKDLQAARADDGVDAILLAIDSPGGAVSGVNAAADMVYAARRDKPTAAHVSGTGASAAYWLGASAERITVDRTALVGSIGVIAAVPKQFNPDSKGTMYVDIVSSNAPNKHPDPTTSEGASEIRGSLDAIEKIFIADVARGRNTTASRVISDFGKGGVMVGNDAVQAGMVDAVQSFETALRHIGRVGKLRGKAA